MANHEGIEERYEFSLDLIRRAGEEANRFFARRESLTVTSKGVQDLASEADMQTELLVKRELQRRYPADGFLGEETGREPGGTGGGLWVVDPIDGTQPFITGLTSWCVSIAYVEQGQLVFGMVFAPARDELFAGGRLHPATLNGRPIAVSKAERLVDGIVAVGYSPKSDPQEFLNIFGRVIRSGGTFYRDGSGALGLCYVACGRLIGYIETRIMSWDCLGAVAVIEAAGGHVSNFFENNGLFDGNHLIAGSPGVCAELQRIYAEASAG